jgi:hypothetical protein
MATTADRIAAPNANRELYAAVDARNYINAAPHLKHRRLVEFHASLIGSVYSAAAQNSQEVSAMFQNLELRLDLRNTFTLIGRRG